MDDITQAVIEGEGMEIGARRAILRYAVQRQMFCPYSGDLLDVRRAVLIDGSDHGHKMRVMTAEVYDTIVANGIWSKWSRDEYDVLDGRELFGRRTKKSR